METETTPKLKDRERTVCEIWTRVMGYLRPSSSFNKWKYSEYTERKLFKQPGNEWVRERGAEEKELLKKDATTIEDLSSKLGITPSDFRTGISMFKRFQNDFVRLKNMVPFFRK